MTENPLSMGVNSKSNLLNLDDKIKSQIRTQSRLLFYEYNCPHCGFLNTRSKDMRDEYVLCSDSGCRKIIWLENIKDIA